MNVFTEAGMSGGQSCGTGMLRRIRMNLFGFTVYEVIGLCYTSSKGKYEEIKATGEPINGYIKKAIDDCMDRDADIYPQSVAN